MQTDRIHLNSNEKLVEELAQAIATDDPNAARIAATVIVGKILDLVERHTVAVEKQAEAMANIAEMLSCAVHHADCGIFVKPR